MYYALGAVGIVLLVQIALLVRVAWALSALAHLDGRVSRLAEAMALLTDTAETGFRTLGEQARVAAPPPAVARSAARPAQPTSTSRVVRAARRGKTVAEIAAAEQVSEGEVRLRLSLADAAGRAPAREGRHGSMRTD